MVFLITITITFLTWLWSDAVNDAETCKMAH